MGGAMFVGWCARGLAPSVVLDPSMPAGLARDNVDVLVADAGAIPADFQPSAVILAIKPQMADSVIPALPGLPPQAVVLSILAGTTIERLASLLAGANPVVRAMPNTPAAIGQGISAAFAGPGVSLAQKQLCTELLEAVGDAVWLESEALIDTVTAVSGSGAGLCVPARRNSRTGGHRTGIAPGARPATRAQDRIRCRGADCGLDRRCCRVAPRGDQPERNHTKGAGRADAARRLAQDAQGRRGCGRKKSEGTGRVKAPCRRQQSEEVAADFADWVG